MYRHLGSSVVFRVVIWVYYVVVRFLMEVYYIKCIPLFRILLFL